MRGRDIQVGDVVHWHDGRDYIVREILDGCMYRDLCTTDGRLLTVAKGSRYSVTR